MNKFVIGSIVAVVMLGGAAFWMYMPQSQTSGDTRTYFTYSALELSPIRDLSSDFSVQTSQVYAWDREVFRLVSKNKYLDTAASRIYAYLLTAQRDFANLSYAMHGSYQGTLAPVSKEVLCLFFQNDCASVNLPDDENQTAFQDAYSVALAKIVVAKVKARMSEEVRSNASFTVREGAEFWSMPQPWIGFETAAWKPWALASNSEFRAPDAPFDAERELAATVGALNAATDAQKKAVVFWAGGPGTKTPPGIWLDIADELLRADQKVSLAEALEVRAAVALAAADAVIGVFDSKYTYWRLRPFMLDPSIRTIMPTPNHPSYPAGHSTISTAAATVLMHYIPEKATEIAARAEEAGISRVWGGIHFPIDDTGGDDLGRSIGEKVLMRMGE